MGDIVDLASARGQRPNPSQTSFKDAIAGSSGLRPGPAQIVLYTGVRYERHGPDYEGPQPSPTHS